MNLLAAFKKPALDAQAMGPARAALNAHMAGVKSLEEKRVALSEQAGTAQREVEAANAAAAEFARLQIAVDEAEGQGRYGGTPVANLDELKTALAAAKQTNDRLASKGRAAQNAHRRFAADAADLSRQLAERNKAVPQLLHAALYESISDYVVEFRQAEAQFRAAHRRAFTAAWAADQVGIMHQLPQYGAKALFAELNVTRPSHPAFLTRTDPTTPGLTNEQRLAAANDLAAEHAQFEQSLLALDREAEEFVNQVLTGAAGA